MWIFPLSILQLGKYNYLEEFNDHFLELKDKSPETAFVLEHDVGFEKWSKAHFSGNMYDVMTTNIVESLNAILIEEREYRVASYLIRLLGYLENRLGRDIHMFLNLRVIIWCRLPKRS